MTFWVSVTKTSRLIMSFLGVPGGYDGTRVTKYTSRPNRCILHAHDHDDHHDHPRKRKKTDPKAYKPKWGFDSATIWKIFGEDGSKWIFLELWWKVSQWWHSSFPFGWRYINKYCIWGEVSGEKVPISQRNRHNTRSPNIARATKSQNPRLPNTAPVTTSDWQRLSMITNTMPAKSQNSRSPNIARYCNCCYCDD